MSATVSASRDAAIEEFAELLCGLRARAGTPSYRVMAGRSGAISHTTLHEAARGFRLPSWGTTAEFVRACGADPAALRDRWERADSVVRAGSTQPVVPPTRAYDEPPAARASYGRVLALVAVLLAVTALALGSLLVRTAWADRQPAQRATGCVAER